MKNYTSYEIQSISSNFRNVARRLSRTDYSQCDSNLKRFMSTIQNEELISDFITKNNTVSFDIEKVRKDRGWLDPFEISSIPNEEISFAMQMLTYSIERYDGNFTKLYGTYAYTKASSTVNDEMHTFINHVIDPLIDYISDYLRICYDEALRKENVANSSSASSVTANNSTVVIGSNVGGNISNKVTITKKQKADASNMISEIKSIIAEEDFLCKDDVEEILQQIKEQIDNGQKPQNGLLAALKALFQTSKLEAKQKVMSIINSIRELFS